MEGGRKKVDTHLQHGVGKLTKRLSDFGVAAADKGETSSSRLDPCTQKSKLTKSISETANSVRPEFRRVIPIAAANSGAQGCRPLIPNRVAANNRPLNASSHCQRLIIKEEDAEDEWDTIIRDLQALGKIFSHSNYNGSTNFDYETCREPVNRLLKMHDQFLKNAEDAAKNGRVDEATFYTQQAIEIKNRARKASRIAYTTLFDLNNRRFSNKITFAIQGQEVDRALIIVKFFLWFGRFGRAVYEFHAYTGYGRGGQNDRTLDNEVESLFRRMQIRHWAVNQSTIGFRVVPLWRRS